MARLDVNISIPVRTMGYTGQRDQWESHLKSHTVHYDGNRIRLQPPSTSYGSAAFEFTEAELKAALDFIRDQDLKVELPERDFIR